MAFSSTLATTIWKALSVSQVQRFNVQRLQFENGLFSAYQEKRSSRMASQSMARALAAQSTVDFDTPR